jgi:nitrite reductase/ring-hydroxylating ferredoxin subunit
MSVTADRVAPGVGELVGRVGPRLADGTWLRELIDFKARAVSLRVLRDPEIHRLELKRIFARAWVCLGHEGEIPAPGDFVTRYVGEDQVIVTRAKDGSVRVLLNVCAHRGMRVCFADEGNRSSFKCPYHGWVFDGTGRLLGAPFENDMYGEWDKSQYGLRAARVGLHHGRIFANFDPDAPSLAEWLGPVGWYLDVAYEDADENPEMDVVLPPRRFVVHANWKISADNNAGDTYHGLSLHRSLFELGLIPPDDRTGWAACLKIGTAEGHGLVVFPDFMAMMGGGSPDGASQYDLSTRTIATMMFPASFGAGGPGNYRQFGPDGQWYRVVQIGGLVPRGADSFELWTGSLIERGAPEAMKEAMRVTGLVDLGGVDDYEGWPLIQRAAHGVLGEQQTMKYHASTPARTPEGFSGPGLVYPGTQTDDSQWNFWLRWFDLMTADER